MTLVRLLLGALLVVGLQACAASRDQSDLPPAATFRRVAALEYYEFRLGISHDGAGSGVQGRDCSTDAYYCYAGVNVLVAPRRCARVLRLLRSRADWRVSSAIIARFLFRSENQLYFASDDRHRQSGGQGGFVYDIERGVIGVWRMSTSVSERPDQPQQAQIIDNTRWLESPATLFACGPRAP